MGRHRVEVDQIHTLSAELTSLGEFLAELMADVDKVANAVTGSWSGDAANAYQVLHDEWVNGAQQMSDGAQLMVTAVGDAGTNYGDAASANLGVWS